MSSLGQAPPAQFESLDRDIRAGAYGYVNRLVVMRGDQTVVSHRYGRDYAEISRGRRSEIGCGEGCPDLAGVANAWNVYPVDAARDGARPRNLQNALMDAMVSMGSTQPPK